MALQWSDSLAASKPGTQEILSIWISMTKLWTLKVRLSMWQPSLLEATRAPSVISCCAQFGCPRSLLRITSDCIKPTFLDCRASLLWILHLSCSHKHINNCNCVCTSSKISHSDCHHHMWPWNPLRLRSQVRIKACIKTTVKSGLYNLPFNFPAWKCQDLETSMLVTRPILVESLGV